MRFLSICSGIEAASVAWHALGWEAVGFSEIEPFPCAVLQHHYPDVPNFGDMTKFKEWRIDGTVDIVCGGTPCQAFSVAGQRKSLEDERGNLSLVFCQLCDHFDPEIVIWENVPGVLNTKDNAFGCFLAELAGLTRPVTPQEHNTKFDPFGVVNGQKRLVAWRTLDAQYFGVPQRRRRVFVVAFRGSGNWRAAATLFPLSESVRGNTTPRRSTTQEVASFTQGSFANYRQSNIGGALRACGGDFSGGSETLVVHGAQDPCVNNEFANPVARNNGLENVICLAGNTIGRQVHNGGNGNGFDETGVSYTLTSTDIHGIAYADVAPTLTSGFGARGVDSNQIIDGGGVVICLGSQHPNSSITESVSPTLTSASGMGGGHIPVISYHQGPSCNQEAFDGDFHIVSKSVKNFVVRRLTPLECERLQGFPDNYTKIPYRGKPAEECPDGPRYKALGNSWAVPVVQWIGARIMQVLNQ